MLHVALMRKSYLKSARREKFKSNLIKFCTAFPTLKTELSQLERYGYGDLSFEAKLQILITLCESQFDFNIKFKETVNFFFENTILVV